MYDELNPISRSNYSPNATGSYKATIYNSSSKDISNFKYNITIPNIGDKIDGYTVQWVPTLNQAIQVKNAPGTIIKYDGSTSFNPNAKNIEITIPTIKIGDLPEIITIFKANNFEEEDRYKRSYIQNKYQIGGEVGIYNAGVAGLRLVPADYDPEAEESYVFCLYPQLELENPNISINECRALIDLYRHTGGDSWRKRNGRNIATQV